MRILHLVAGNKWTGTAAVVFDQTAALVRAGMEVQYGFVGKSPLAARLPPLGWARPLLTRPRTPLDFVRDFRSVRDTVLREKFDIVHAHSTHDHYTAALALAGTPARLVRTLHNMRHVRKDWVSRALYRRTRSFAFTNQAIAARFGRPGPIHSPVVDPDRFFPDSPAEETFSRFGLPRGQRFVGTVGKMSPGRGHEEAIRAAAPLMSVSLVHVGHGEEMPRLKRLAAELGSEGRNFWLGYQEGTLPELYRCWELLLFPASGSEQGQRAILEGMASGVPAVAIDVPGVRDLMTDGVEGRIVARASDLAGALAGLIESPRIRLRMAEKARVRSLDFTAEKFVAKASEFYDGLGDKVQLSS